MIMFEKKQTIMISKSSPFSNHNMEGRQLEPCSHPCERIQEDGHWEPVCCVVVLMTRCSHEPFDHWCWKSFVSAVLLQKVNSTIQVSLWFPGVDISTSAPSHRAVFPFDKEFSLLSRTSVILDPLYFKIVLELDSLLVRGCFLTSPDGQWFALIESTIEVENLMFSLLFGNADTITVDPVVTWVALDDRDVGSEVRTNLTDVTHCDLNCARFEFEQLLCERMTGVTSF